MGLPLADTADPLVGRLERCRCRGGNLANGVLYWTPVLLRRHRRWRDTNVAVAKRIRIECDETVPYQIDGDPGGFLPLEIEVVPQRLNINVPEAWAKSHKLPIPEPSTQSVR